jgi:succinyl-CoA synthetase beta subunit
MTKEERSGLAPSQAPSPAPPESLQALTEEIDRTRQELGETVEALVAKVDVKARARDKAAELAGRVSGTASQLKDADSQVKVLLAITAGGALLAGWLTVRLRRR